MLPRIARECNLTQKDFESAIPDHACVGSKTVADIVKKKSVSGQSRHVDINLCELLADVECRTHVERIENFNSNVGMSLTGPLDTDPTNASSDHLGTGALGLSR